MYKGYKCVPDLRQFIEKSILRGQCHGRMATVRRPFIAASTAPKVENVINLDQTFFFSFKTYSVLGNLYNVESLMYVQMRVMDQDEKDKETCAHNIEKK